MSLFDWHVTLRDHWFFVLVMTFVDHFAIPSSRVELTGGFHIVDTGPPSSIALMTAQTRMSNVY